MKELPWFLAIVHAAIALLIFGIAATSEASAGLPILIVLLDYPASLLAQWLTELLPNLGQTLENVIDAVVYTIVGSVWFYLIGWLLRAIFQKLKRKDQVDRPAIR